MNEVFYYLEMLAPSKKHKHIPPKVLFKSILWPDVLCNLHIIAIVITPDIFTIGNDKNTSRNLFNFNSSITAVLS